MIIESKFDIDDKVYVIQKKIDHFTAPCKYCEDNKYTICPFCNGKKEITVYVDLGWIVLDYTYNIDEISVFRGRDKESDFQRYSLSSYDKLTYISSLSWKDMFSTKKEAIKECDKRNVQ